MKRLIVFFISILSRSAPIQAQAPGAILDQLVSRLEKVNDYEADATFKTEISFLKVPDARVKIYYKKPNLIRIKNENGISLVPKETSGLSLYSLLRSPGQSLDAGADTLQGIPVRIIKIIPSDENGELVLATLFIDARRMLVLKAKTTTRENGTSEVELFYGRFLPAGLPDKIIFSFNTRDFKLPKGVTFDYDDGSVKKKLTEADKVQRGRIEISYLNYRINQGLNNAIFH